MEGNGDKFVLYSRKEELMVLIELRSSRFLSHLSTELLPGYLLTRASLGEQSRA